MCDDWRGHDIRGSLQQGWGGADGLARLFEECLVQAVDEGATSSGYEMQMRDIKATHVS